MNNGMISTTAPDRTGTPTASAALRGVSLVGPCGRLEALVNEGALDAPFAALVCHPHPLGGGTLHNKVVYHAMKALNDPVWGLGWPVLRFNFRGTGLSAGAHDGAAEADDVRAALDWLENENTRPMVVVGFSFGAAMAVSACCGPSGARVSALAALGLPLRSDDREYEYSCLQDCTIPKLFLSGDRDQFAPATQLAKVAASAAEPRRLQLIAGADHFFSGQLELLQKELRGWLKEQLL
jgi:alpha/beta superfamily hydrolase